MVVYYDKQNVLILNHALPLKHRTNNLLTYSVLYINSKCVKMDKTENIYKRVKC